MAEQKGSKHKGGAKMATSIKDMPMMKGGYIAAPSKKKSGRKR